MNRTLMLQGRSLPINVVLILANLFGVFLIVLGTHHLTYESAGLYTWSGIALTTVSLISLVVLKGMFLYSYVARVLVGSLFIVSGLIKANDPSGFQFKLEDYFQKGALDMEWLNDYALPLAVILAVGEILLGVAVILGGKLKLSSWLLLLMIGFFTWLTFYTASCNQSQQDHGQYASFIKKGDDKLAVGETHNAELFFKKADTISDGGEVAKERLDLIANLQGLEYSKLDTVVSTPSDTFHLSRVSAFERVCVTDCGCFGDAFKGSFGRAFEPWESFTKDIVLLYLVLIILFSMRKIKWNSLQENIILIPASLGVMIFLCWVFSWWFPLVFTAVVLFLGLVTARLLPGKIDGAWKAASVVAILSLAVCLYTINYLPIKDYRGYAIGEDIRTNMEGETAKMDIEFGYLNSETGEVYYINQDDLNSDTTWYDTKTWLPWYRVETIRKHAKDPSVSSSFMPIMKEELIPEWWKESPAFLTSMENYYLDNFDKAFVLCDTTQDVPYCDTVDIYSYDPEYYPDSVYEKRGETWTPMNPGAHPDFSILDFILDSDRIFLMTIYKPEKMTADLDDFVELYKLATEQRIPFVIITTSMGGLDENGEPNEVSKTIDKVREAFGQDAPIATMDNKELKILVRSNPGLLYLEKGVVVNKWAHKSVPNSLEKVKP